MKLYALAAILTLGSTAAVALMPPPPAGSHGDGVSTRSSISLSNGLMTDENGNQVRAVSYSVSFLGPGRVSLARMHGLKILESSSSTTFQEDIRGVFPDLMSATPSLEPHAYTIHVSPRPGATWGEVSASDVVIGVVRQE